MISLLAIFLVFDPASSQTVAPNWSSPYQLSDSNNKAGIAVLAADMYGNVHCFWAEQLPDSSSLIKYTRFDGKEWSAPVSLHQTAAGGRIVSISTDVSPDGNLYLAWNEGNNGPLFLINAPAYDAQSVDQWSQPLVIKVPAEKHQVRVDGSGVVHLVYLNIRGEQPGAYYLSINQDKQTVPTNIGKTVPENYLPAWLDFEMDEQGGLFASWYYGDNNLPAFPGRLILFTQSLDGGEHWISPVTIDEDTEQNDKLRLPAPDISIFQNRIVTVYAGDQPTHRFFSYSSADGQSWTRPEHIFGDLVGQALGDGLAVDAVGKLHFVGQLRYPQGLYHSYLDQSLQWSAPELFYLISKDPKDPIGERLHAHGIRLAIQAGNQLVITFQDRNDKEHLPLYAMVSKLDIDPAEIQPTPTKDVTASSPTAVSQLSPTETGQNGNGIESQQSERIVIVGIVVVVIVVSVLSLLVIKTRSDSA